MQTSVLWLTTMWNFPTTIRNRVMSNMMSQRFGPVWNRPCKVRWPRPDQCVFGRLASPINAKRCCFGTASPESPSIALVWQDRRTDACQTLKDQGLSRGWPEQVWCWIPTLAAPKRLPLDHVQGLEVELRRVSCALGRSIRGWLGACAANT